MSDEGQKVFLTGYARLPSGIVASELSKVVGISLVVNRDTGIVLDADCTLVTRVAREFVRTLLVGRSLRDDAAELEREIIARYHGNAQKALVAALRIAHEKFLQL